VALKIAGGTSDEYEVTQESGGAAPNKPIATEGFWKEFSISNRVAHESYTMSF